QLDFEDQSGPSRNDRRMSAVPVGDVGRTGQHRLTADFHLLNAFSPASNYLIQRKLSRLISLIKAVEFGAVGYRSAISHLNGIRVFRRGARAGLGFLVNQSTIGLNGARLGGGFFEICLGAFLFF